jgi:hypothetical protein
MKQVNMSDEAR